jgi:hypothetical protein
LALFRQNEELRELDQNGLAKLAQVGINTVRSIERAGSGHVRARTSTLDAVVSALRAAGLILVDVMGDGPGARLRKARK